MDRGVPESHFVHVVRDCGDIRARSLQLVTKQGRIMAAMDYINQHPVVHTWSYRLDEAA
jgi:hypothetical protein